MPPPLNPLGAVLCCAGWNQVWRQQRPAADAAPTYRSRDSVASCICCSLARSLASSRKAQTRLQHLQRTAAAPVTVSVSVSAAESVGRLNHMIAIMCKPPEKASSPQFGASNPNIMGSSSATAPIRSALSLCIPLTVEPQASKKSILLRVRYKNC